MYGISSKKDPLSDPKITALMAAVESQSEQENATKTKKNELPHPARNYEEFLKEEKINEWPQKLTSESTLDLTEINTSLWREDKILEELHERAPLDIDLLSDLGCKIDDYSSKLDAFSAHIVSSEELPSRFKENLFHAPTKAELEKAADSDAVALHHSRRKKKDPRQTMVEAMQASRSKNIDYVSFPGFRKDELTELPSQLEAPQLLNKITEAQSFNKGFGQLWKKIFLSEATISLLQDTFWWFFLEHFEHNPSSQDKLYTRIADSYVALFLSINMDIRDKVFQVFPRCFAQCVYLTFREAFPESEDRLGEEFVSEVSSSISEWMSGVKPPINDWKTWPWEKMCSPPGEIKGQAMPQPDQEKTQGARRASEYIKELQMDLANAVPPRTADSSATSDDRPGLTVTAPADSEKRASAFGSEKSPRQESTTNLPKPGRTTTPSTQVRDPSFRPKEPGDSAQTGPGPDYERVMFNLGGRSPLVAHYLFMKQLRDKNLVGRLMKRTEVLQHPPSAPTFQDVIRHSKKTVKDLHEERTRMMALTIEESIKQETLRRAVAAETKREQNALKDPLEIKMRSDRVLDQALGGGLHRPSSYGRIKSPNPQQDELLHEDPDVLFVDTN